MFRRRTSSAKPGDDLLVNFRQQFPEVAAVSTSTTAPAISQTTAAENPIVQAPPPPERAQGIAQDVFRDQDPTPRVTNGQWRFTPSLLDPNSPISFANFANAPPGYYTPTPGGTFTLSHPQAGDLHTPTLGLGIYLGTPLSMPTSGDGTQFGPGTVVMDMTGFQTLQPHQFHHFTPFIQAPPPQPAFAPSTFVHQDPPYETMDQDSFRMETEALEELMTSIDSAVQNPPPVAGLPTRQFPSIQIPHPLPASAEKFRFHATLNAPTAMIKHADEIPITYLNKGQAYLLSITDTNTTLPIVPGTKYRTFVRISFEDDQQRQRPGVRWGLWKEGRGTNEAHQRRGKLQAVEYVEAGQPAEGYDDKTHVELESSSFDGFSVMWTPRTNGAAEVNIAVRFNFLSTDFSYSKGVKGIPVRLCAKTNPVPSDPSLPVADVNPEICFCKVKLFRDHGAERRLTNDVAHVKKSIDKLKQQIAQAESGIKDFGKRKPSSASSKTADMQRPGKVIKHKRTWSISSASSAGGGGWRMSFEEDLHFKLQTLQDMFTSTRPVSVLFLRGEELDDPNLYPVSLPGDASPLTNTEGRVGPNWQARSGRSSMTGSMISPSPISLSLASQTSALSPGSQCQNFDSVAAGDMSRNGSDQPMKVSKADDDGNLSGWIEALGVDPSYRLLQERSPTPVACFYVVRRSQQEPDQKEYHRAIYLMQRTLKELTHRIAAKWGIDTSQIARTIHTTRNGLEVEMDDDVVRELKEGQAMALEIEETEQSSGVKREWEMAVDSIDGSPDTESSDKVAGGLVLRLTF
ncbi:CP2 transcription factor-domain-containing protein [Ilyonectria destructans]|nr:CP2 transcription factor-domain-containing protein [Ilyonectria destructans]